MNFARSSGVRCALNTASMRLVECCAMRTLPLPPHTTWIQKERVTIGMGNLLATPDNVTSISKSAPRSNRRSSTAA